MPQRSQLFSLVELLVVCVIILLLLMLLASGVKRGVETARLARCNQQLKQAGITTQVYAQDNDGHFPEFYYTKNVHHTKGGFVLLEQPWKCAMPGWSKYPRDLITCPSDWEPGLRSVLMDDGTIKDIPVSYAVNIVLDVNDITIQRIVKPSECLFVYDGATGRNPDEPGKWQGRFWDYDEFTDATLRNRHALSSGIANLLFTDWHVQNLDGRNIDPVWFTSAEIIVGDP